jgi:L-2-hydroxyglutarate oxidase LhgO
MVAFKVETVVIGAGVIGLAVARALALRGREVLVLERERGIGYGSSSRTSEVIHAGLYYPTGSLKARLCVAGRDALYRYCSERAIPHRRCGKLVIATTSGEDPVVEVLGEMAAANGVKDIELIGTKRLKTLEPHLHGTSALVSPSTGIVDSHALMIAYQADAEAAGATFSFQTPVADAAFLGDTIRLRTGGNEPAAIEAGLVINAAGLDAWEFSARLEGLDTRTIPPKYLAKGNYFTLTEKAPFRHLIYPVPQAGGLGVHLTFDLGGQSRFGPDVEWIDHVDYAVEPKRASAFYTDIRRYWPDLADGALLPAYAGIRGRTTGPDQEPGDFVIQGPGQTGLKGYVALYGIESPGLTASIAIGEYVADLALTP